MALQTVNKINDYLTDMVHRYPYLFAKLEKLEYVTYKLDFETLDYILILHYKNDTYEFIKIAEPKEIITVLEAKNLELQPNRGGRASLLHI